MESQLASQLAGLSVNSGTLSVNSAGNRLKNKRSQRFTVPVQPAPAPVAASPPFSNSTSDEGGSSNSYTNSNPASASAALSNTYSGHSQGQPDSHSFTNGFQAYAHPYQSTDAVLFPPPANFAQTHMNVQQMQNGQHQQQQQQQQQHAFLQQDPFAHAGGTAGRSRTQSTGSAGSSAHQVNINGMSNASMNGMGQWGTPSTSNQAFDAFAGMNAGSGQQGHFNQQQPRQYQQPQPQQGGPSPAPTPDQQSDDIIPTAIVIKNIPFNFPSPALMQIIEELTLAPPYAFNYHYDMGVFRGLAFANFHTPQETDSCVAALNGFEIQGRKLRVEYKKVLQAGEKERIERDKALKRMRSMQLERDRIINHQQAHVQHLQQQMFGGPVPQLPMQHQQQNMMQGQFQQMGHQHTLSNDDFEDYGRAVHPSNAMYSNHAASMHQQQNQASMSPPMGSEGHPAGYSASSSGASTSSRVNGAVGLLPTELDMNDGQTLELYSRVLLFKEDALRDELAFSKSLTNVQRRIVHLIAQKLQLDHRSAGSGDERCVIVSKPGADGATSAGSHQGRSLRTRASAYPMLNPDPYAPPQPSLLPEGMAGLNAFNNALRGKKSMPDLRHQQQHPLYSNNDYQQQQAMRTAQGYQTPTQANMPPLSAGAASPSSRYQNATITPRHSTHDLRSVAASASNRRSQHFNTVAPGEGVPPVPPLPMGITSPGTNVMTNAAPGSERQSLILNNAAASALLQSFDSPVKSAGSGSQGAPAMSLDSKIVGSPVHSATVSTPNTPSSGQGVVRQPRGPDSMSSWARAAAIAAGSNPQ